ncbi:troponin C, skeletal muscle, putative [Perkinsus marinus ATCC 50983]|uniref:Troponin C, skeletal muscle, putative n=1 Tax=Perkinsus marinus (strain ATCC 50983 / TXsc) TaxID=423536 RepID=C5KGP6_PERM5|nr:troponin C, skeletal muscle, putative [Perkinsus marinus ATCC 50983]EER16314.1 troponin C, skeletal muscle, putative [Perkinsus marinus ATCC 50983]|eukprot:XP_002784518.1 troponin C, skeletal muscle, putative [Perkinsus marinus ATCC 50983]
MNTTRTESDISDPTREEMLCKIIRRSFDLFDKLGTGTVVPEEIGTIMRYLGQFPTETELVEVVIRELKDNATTDNTTTGSSKQSNNNNITKSTPIAYHHFEKVMLRCLKEHEYDPDDSETLLEAFHVLDPDRKGWVDTNQMRDYLGSGHTGFREKEMSEFIQFARDGGDDRDPK